MKMGFWQEQGTGAARDRPAACGVLEPTLVATPQFDDKVRAWHLAGLELQCHITACSNHEGPRQGPGDVARAGASPNPWLIAQDWVTTGHHMGDRTQQTLLQEAGKKKG